MAEDMQIFGDLAADQSLTDDVHLARGFTAWGLFSVGSYLAIVLSQPYQANARAVSPVSIFRRNLPGRTHPRRRCLLQRLSARFGYHIPKSG